VKFHNPGNVISGNSPKTGGNSDAAINSTLINLHSATIREARQEQL